MNKSSLLIDQERTPTLEMDGTHNCYMSQTGILPRHIVGKDFGLCCQPLPNLCVEF